jgi:hypothetical protein
MARKKIEDTSPADDCLTRYLQRVDRELDREARRVNPCDDLPRRFAGEPPKFVFDKRALTVLRFNHGEEANGRSH